MPRLVMKSPYLPPRKKNHLSNYVKYIATREGVERTDDTKKNLPATKRQQDSLAKLLKKYPDSKELHEYEDYKQRPTRGNADELILRIAEAHPELLGGRDGYVTYIANRPGTEKLSSHGLFTDEGVPVVLDKTAREIADCESNVWTHIISLRREDADEQREEVIRTYTDTMPERIPLSANKDFKSIKNAVIDEAMKLCADASVIKSGSSSDSPAGSVGNAACARENAMLGVINLMRYVGRIFDNDIRDGDRRDRMGRKEYQKIAEKKQAHGQKMES